MGLEDKREIVETARENGLSERRVCKITGFNRSGLNYEHKPQSEFSKTVEEETKFLAKAYRLGYQKVHKLLKKLGFEVNHKRIESIWKKFKLALPRRKKRKKTRVPYTRPHKAKSINDVWCYDFLFAKTEHGDMLKVFAVLDEYSRECLAIKVDRRINSYKVMSVLKEVIERRGKPKHLRSDNGPEFVAQRLRDWAQENGIQNQFIEPGCPWQNGFIESFNGKFRDECISRESFWSRAEAQSVSNWWKEVYNHFRPHQSLDYKTPAEFAQEADSASLHQPLDLDKNLDRLS